MRSCAHQQLVLFLVQPSMHSDMDVDVQNSGTGHGAGDGFISLHVGTNFLPTGNLRTTDRDGAMLFLVLAYLLHFSTRVTKYASLPAADVSWCAFAGPYNLTFLGLQTDNVNGARCIHTAGRQCRAVPL